MHRSPIQENITYSNKPMVLNQSLKLGPCDGVWHAETNGTTFVTEFSILANVDFSFTTETFERLSKLF